MAKWYIRRTYEKSWFAFIQQSLFLPLSWLWFANCGDREPNWFPTQLQIKDQKHIELKYLKSEEKLEHDEGAVAEVAVGALLVGFIEWYFNGIETLLQRHCNGIVWYCSCIVMVVHGINCNIIVMVLYSIARYALGWVGATATPRAAAVNSKCTFHSQGNGLAKI